MKEERKRSRERSWWEIEEGGILCVCVWGWGSFLLHTIFQFFSPVFFGPVSQLLTTGLICADCCLMSVKQHLTRITLCMLCVLCHRAVVLYSLLLLPLPGFLFTTLSC